MPLAPFGRKYAAQRVFMGNGAPFVITGLWCALLNEAALDSSTGTTIKEPTAAAYERIPVLFNADNVVVGAGGNGYFKTAIYWPMVLAESWGAIVGYALCTAKNGGELFAYDTLPLTIPIGGDVPQIPENTMTFAIPTG